MRSRDRPATREIAPRLAPLGLCLPDHGVKVDAHLGEPRLEPLDLLGSLRYPVHRLGAHSSLRRHYPRHLMAWAGRQAERPGAATRPRSCSRCASLLRRLVARSDMATQRLHTLGVAESGRNQAVCERVKQGGNHRAGSTPRGMAQTDVSRPLTGRTYEVGVAPPRGRKPADFYLAASRPCRAAVSSARPASPFASR
jgi:hypothetical protein